MSRSEVTDADREEVAAFIEDHWHSKMVMSRGRVFYPHQEHGIIERRDHRLVGLLTYHIDAAEGMEILTLNSTVEGAGIGSSLMVCAIDIARRKGAHRVWLTTTNDCLRVIGFQQRLGFRMIAINLGVVDEARKTKPAIPVYGERGVRVQDEIVMELLIEPYLERE